ncbi:SMI1-KNR4 cell-wall [Paenibacillus algorifonticola]|uniref:SMI1-KNR4 cell-wall n=1 Tax=Paenibacillus algorifonticola TaxID=684063 RepID=A0A1I2CMY6_9BACL|nr:SMI1/KNR4 family protein [Paenibacillus algorifonticola]SFE69482.1 SMI1-KNR4 cell-wall [Paenibacillus algorifonticola]
MYASLKNKLEHPSAIKWFAGRQVEEAWIAEAEAELGQQLPASYKWWLREYGNAQLSGSVIFTLVPPEFKDISDSDLLYNHRLNREHDWIPQGRLYIYVPDADEAYFFDMKAWDGQNEGEVMREDYLGGDVEVYAQSFAQFLEKLIDEHS